MTGAPRTQFESDTRSAADTYPARPVSSVKPEGIAARDGQGGHCPSGVLPHQLPAADLELSGLHALTWDGPSQTLVISSEGGEIARITHPNALALLDNLRALKSQGARGIYLDGVLHTLQLMEGPGK